MNFRKLKSEEGITLIALIITIIVLLILAGVSIITLTGENGTLTRVQTAKKQSEKGKLEEEVKLAITNLQIEENQREMTQEEKREELEKELKKQDSNSTVSIDGSGFIASHGGYNFNISDNYKVSIKEPFNAEEWDKTAAPENIFIWGSDDPNNEEYRTVVGYTQNITNYTILKYPSRCKKIELNGKNYQTHFGEEEIYDPLNRVYLKLGDRNITSNIKKIELPESIVKIGIFAFGGTYGGNSFGGYNFTSLKEIELPNSVTNIDDLAFYYCDSLTKITIPESITNIGKNAFCTCNNLKEIYIDKEPLTVYGEPWGATNATIKWKEIMTEEEKIKWDKTAADEDCFYWGSNDPNSEGYGKVIGYTKKIDNYTILRFPTRCTEITYGSKFGDIEFEDGVGVYESRTFTNNIKKIEIPGTVEILDLYTGNLAFKSVEKVTIEEGVREIGRAAFFRCSKLNDITIPNSVTSIGDVAFENTQWYNNQPDGLIYAGKVAYKYKGNMSSNTNIEIKQGTTEIAGYCFDHCTNLSSITIPNNIKKIGWQAFSNCSSLKSVIYKDEIYTNKSALVQALNNNSVTVEKSAFDNTGLSD